jgi:hypothetical protein
MLRFCDSIFSLMLNVRSACSSEMPSKIQSIVSVILAHFIATLTCLQQRYKMELRAPWGQRERREGKSLRVYPTSQARTLREWASQPLLILDQRTNVCARRDR